MGYSFVDDFISNTVSFPGRCPLTGRFMSTSEFGDDEPMEHFFGVVCEATDEVVTPDDADEDDVDVDNNDGAVYWLSPKEEAEFHKLNRKLGTDYWHPDDLMTLRRLDGLRWVEETYGDCRYGAPATDAPAVYQMGRSGFGAEDKPMIIGSYGYNDGRGRRGFDDTRKNRKAAIRRFRRSARKLRTVEHSLSLLY